MIQDQDLTSPEEIETASTDLVHCILLGFGVFLLCLAGIISRSQLDLASLWPANGFMLGMIIRFPHLARLESWIAGAVGFFMADMLTGQDFSLNLLLNSINLACILVGYLLMARLPEEDRLLRRPSSMLYFLRAVIAASVVAGLGGILASAWLFSSPPLEGFFRWASSELVNLTAIVPLLLAIPPARSDDNTADGDMPYSGNYPAFLPPLALLLSGVAGILADGPGAMAFPVPALLWCALRYNLFSTACLSFAFSVWTLLMIRAGWLEIGIDLSERTGLISTRFGVAMIALAPIVVASIMTAQRQLLLQVRHQANFDFLTGLRNRRSFWELGEKRVAATMAQEGSVAVMMIDVDHFKAINDTKGHSVGDEVLVHLARVLEEHIRPQDTVARVGGEEFAVILPGCNLAEAVSIAERLNGVVRSTPVLYGNGQSVSFTISIGVHVDYKGQPLSGLLRHADKALYNAKTSGRDCFRLSER